MPEKSLVGCHRLRRLRQSAWCRDMLQENHLTAQDLILPVFIREQSTAKEIASFPGVTRLTLEELIIVAQEAYDLGIPAIALFPVIDVSLKTPDGIEALNPKSLIVRAVRLLKEKIPHLGVICDVALDPYTTHGHDGLYIEGKIPNDETVAILCKQALLLAQAGADAVAPSDMMDGRIQAIRKTLDREKFLDTLVISYAVKFASAFYGPFRNAVDVTCLAGDKKTYQLNPANIKEALMEMVADEKEQADMLIVKPGMCYLDVLHQATQLTRLPVLAYQVSGEYTMIKLAGQYGSMDANKMMMESLIAFKRAGARAIFTYAAMDVARAL